MWEDFLVNLAHFNAKNTKNYEIFPCKVLFDLLSYEFLFIACNTLTEVGS